MAFLFCELFSLRLLLAKRKADKQLALSYPRRLLHRCRRSFFLRRFSDGGFAACFIDCGCVIANQSLALRERWQPKADGEGVRYLTPHPPRKLGTFSRWRRLLFLRVARLCAAVTSVCHPERKRNEVKRNFAEVEVLAREPCELSQNRRDLEANSDGFS